MQCMRTHVPIFIESPLSSEFDSMDTDAVVRLNLVTGDDPDDPQVNEADLLSILQPHFCPLPSINQF